MALVPDRASSAFPGATTATRHRWRPWISAARSVYGDCVFARVFAATAAPSVYFTLE
tara:strand:- start:3530 stop:3700 length:171 start_codon:yes stop_codon:yes gene_type:complete